jgi:hypothetical protein
LTGTKALSEYKIALEIISACPRCLQRFRSHLKENGKISDFADQRSKVEMWYFNGNKEHTSR